MTFFLVEYSYFNGDFWTPKTIGICSSSKLAEKAREEFWKVNELPTQDIQKEKLIWSHMNWEGHAVSITEIEIDKIDFKI